MPINFLTGDRSLRQMRDRAQDFARERYDPSVFSPMINVAREQATRGIDVDRRAEDVVGGIMRGGADAETMQVAGTAGRALAATGERDRSRADAISDAYTQMELADEEIRRGAQDRMGELQTKARQTAGMREAAIEEAELGYQSERDRRRRSLGATALGLAAEYIPGSGVLDGILGRGDEEAPVASRFELFDDDIVDGAIDMGEDLTIDGPIDFDRDPMTFRDAGGFPLEDSLWYEPEQPTITETREPDFETEFGDVPFAEPEPVVDEFEAWYDEYIQGLRDQIVGPVPDDPRMVGDFSGGRGLRHSLGVLMEQLRGPSKEDLRREFESQRR